MLWLIIKEFLWFPLVCMCVAPFTNLRTIEGLPLDTVSSLVLGFGCGLVLLFLYKVFWYSAEWLWNN